MKVAINETTLTAIGDAIREMTGKSDLIAPAAMPTEIRGIETGGGSVEVEPIELTGDCGYVCAGSIAGNYIDLFGNTITTKDVSNMTYMFFNNFVNEIPFDINIANNNKAFSSAFYNCVNLKQIPLIKGNLIPPTGEYTNNPHMDYLFCGLNSVRNIPYDYFDNFGGEEFWTAAQQYGAMRNYMFAHCYSLRQLPDISKLGNRAAYYNCFYANAFYCCYVLDEITDVPVLNTTFTNNAFGTSFVSYCHRLKEFTFQTNEDGTPKTANWKSQIIYLDSDIGWYTQQDTNHHITKYNSGITWADNVVRNATEYEARKNNPDWFSESKYFSRYDHDSAVNTINSLPDTSAYLTANGGTNTIKFAGAAGRDTDGGAINTLTEEEIAVAAAKGWTVSFT